MEDHIYEDTSLAYTNEFEESSVDQYPGGLKKEYSLFWTKENITKLISAVKAQPALWQTSNEDCKSFDVVQETAWHKVATEYFCEEIDVNALIAKWQSLLKQYRELKQKFIQTKKKPVWKFYFQMSFVDEELSKKIDGEKTSNTSKQYHIKPKNNGISRKIEDSTFWRNQQNVLKLINAVKKRRALWKCDDKNYKIRAIREKAWEAVRNEFKNRVSINQLAAKWQNLRTIYRRTRKKQVGLKQAPYWKYYAHLTFLHAVEQSETEKDEDDDELEVEEAHFEIESIEAKEIPQFDECSNEIIDQSDYNDNVELNMASSTIVNESDSVQNFSNFFTSELRKIKNNAHRELTQRKVLQFLWQCMDEELG